MSKSDLSTHSIFDSDFDCLPGRNVSRGFPLPFPLASYTIKYILNILTGIDLAHWHCPNAQKGPFPADWIWFCFISNTRETAHLLRFGIQNAVKIKWNRLNSLVTTTHFDSQWSKVTSPLIFDSDCLPRRNVSRASRIPSQTLWSPQTWDSRTV